MIRGVHHVAVVVQDMDTMLGFYRDTLGFPEAVEMSWEAGADEVDAIIGVPGSAAEVRILRAGNAYLELFRFAAPRIDPLAPDHSAATPGVRHAAFDVVDIEAEVARLEAAGIRFNHPPVQVELNGRLHKTTYFRDPEGNVMELQELLGPDHPMGLPGA